MNLPSDLFEQVKKFIAQKGSIYKEENVFYFIDCTVEPQKLTFEKWLYHFPPPTEKYFLKENNDQRS